MRLRAFALLLLIGCHQKAPPPAPAPKVEEFPVSAPKVVVPAPPVKPVAIRVMVGGDLLPHRPSLNTASAIAESLTQLSSTFAQADSVVANYEAATGLLDPKANRLVYAAPPDWAAELPKAGIHAVTVANNHACDLGDAGLKATLAATEKSGLVTLGGGQDPWEPKVIAEKDGKKICAVAWTTVMNSESACAKSPLLAAAVGRGAKASIDRAMAHARTQCDATIAILHGGEEYKAQTSTVMDIAGHAAEAGADAVVIHHPHIASPIVVHTTHDGRAIPIFSSVGNLVTNQGESWKPPMNPVLFGNRRLVCVNGWTRLGVLADFTFHFDGDAPTLDWSEHLLWIENEHAENKNVAVPRISVRLLDPTGDKAIIDKLSEDRRGPDELFTDSCWAERSAPDARCHTRLVHGAPPPPSQVASRTPRKKK